MPRAIKIWRRKRYPTSEGTNANARLPFAFAFAFTAVNPGSNAAVNGGERRLPHGGGVGAVGCIKYQGSSSSRFCFDMNTSTRVWRDCSAAAAQAARGDRQSESTASAGGGRWDCGWQQQRALSPHGMAARSQCL